MLKNVVIPLALIVIAGIATGYTWNQERTVRMFSPVGIVIMCISSLYIAYYLSFKLFPDNRNVPLPKPSSWLTYYRTQKNHPQPITRGSIAGAILGIFLSCICMYGATRLSSQLKSSSVQESRLLTK